MTNSPSPIHIELEGTPQEVRAALIRLRSKLSLPRFAHIDVGTLEIVLGEVLNNVVEHALAGRKDGRIALTCDLGENCWNVLVRDNGAPMPDNNLPSGIAPDVSIAMADLPEGGFGWSLVRMLAHDIHYHRNNGWNTLSLRVDC
ncbi:ATP-binding protein [Shimia aestuarii]|uniref:Serine/threonine-protein kinase RsbW n=1 Tax=Shimia aestuarii TaxID=254406 RepID=A0A1I4MU50_9RHOB|nr:ATP-binding protein [Shimia aestuarii]SFM06590.1 serine/threonine-protein kinase RsbW [Shimia aestuarii]